MQLVTFIAPKAWQTSSVNGHRVNILVFVGHRALVQVFDSAIVAGSSIHGQHVNDWVWLFSNKTLVWSLKSEVWNSYDFHMSQEIFLLFFSKLSKVVKKKKNILGSWTMQNRWQAGSGLQAVIRYPLLIGSFIQQIFTELHYIWSPRETFVYRDAIFLPWYIKAERKKKISKRPRKDG